MKDYSEIMEDLPRLTRERDDALRDEDWALSHKLTCDISLIEQNVEAWLDDKLTLIEVAV